MNKKKLILIGGGGHCKSCIDVIEQEGKYEIMGILDLPEKRGEQILGYEVIGNDEEYEKYHRQNCEFLITVGQIKTASKRKKIFEKLTNIEAKIATVISPRAYVSKHATVEKGTIVMHNAFINAGVNIGKNCILNTSCIIEHDAIVENHCHVSTNTIINGDSRIGEASFIGSNAIISNQIRIGEKVIVGAGAVVTKNVDDSKTVVGVPAKKIME